jgi:hypothetical protein
MSRGALFWIELFVVVFSDRYAVLGRKSEEIISVYSILPSREPESRQVAFFDPAQDGNFTDTTVPRDDTGGEIFRVGSYQVYSQVFASFDRIYGIIGV